MHDKQAPQVIAICGIDGSGKTTLFERLRSDPGFQHAHFVRNRDNEILERVLRMNGPVDPMPDAYLQGPLAEAIRWAQAFDFLRHFETTLTPLLDSGHLLVSDRWSFCAITCGDAGTAIGAQIASLLRHVPRPSLTIYLAVDEVTATERLLRRGPLLDDEHLEMLRAYGNAYEVFFRQYDGPLLRIPSVSAEETYQTVRDGIRARLGL